MKRVFDLLVSATMLLVLCPLLVVIALVVWFDLGRPVLFTQKRPGLRGRLFVLYKFRTMSGDEKDANLPDDARLSRIGRILRRLSLDELPELFNVFKGDMSLVGPRPLLAEYLPLYNTFQSRRHEVRPGLTGWAQINGRNALPWEERFELDVWYVDNRSFLLDLKILLITVGLVLSGEGIHEPGGVTMSRFTGSAE